MTSKFNTKEIMKQAWAGYRTIARDMRETTFNRARFNYELRLAWTQARSRLPDPPPPSAPAIVALPKAQQERVDNIRGQILYLELGDFIDWKRHGELRLQIREALAA